MSLIPYVDLDQLDPELHSAMDPFEKEYGRPSLVRRMLANYPPLLRAFDELDWATLTAEGQLDRMTKELLFVASSNQRGCFY
jgi:hypothetical protein